MKFKQIAWLAFISVSFFHCGKSGVTQKAVDSVQTLEKEISDAKCNGKGTAFSAVYQVNAKPGKAQCEGDEPIEMVEAEFDLDCIQKNQTFSCKISDYTWNGCINQDGSFILGIKENADYMKDVMQLKDGETSLQAVGKITGKIAGEGNIYVAVVVASGNKKKGCSVSWPISIDVGQKSDNTENSQK